MWLLLFASALAAPLTLDEVLDRVDERVPQLAAAEARLHEAEAKVLSKRGAFDPVLSGKGSVYTTKYPRSQLNTSLSAATPWGPSLELGWARGIGDFPAYDGQYETVENGELYGSLTVPLLDGLGYGKDRASVDGMRAAQAGKQAALVDVQRKLRLVAAKRYWAWVAACQALEVAERQLELAQKRNAAFQREVEVGSRAQLDLLDNERALLERQSELAYAQQKVHLSALDLSLLLRDGAGAPRVPARDEAPEHWPALMPLPSEARDLTALSWRPDRSKLAAELQQATVEERRAQNGVLPKLNVSATSIQPLQDGEPTELVGGVSFEAPVAFRESVGERRAATARVAAAREELRALDDQIRVEIDGALETRRLAEVRADAARLAAQRAEQVLQMERRRFELGGSDLFKLLLREEYLGKAQKTAVEAEYALRVADAAVRAALVQ